ncbi:hypothetical protein B0T16DRAFT_157706 [Cercophora newfieldiana]|uniref:Uncharacterized protein n=1 Tax=Cercophora newfieldiana TaxID=92897 RepID=A0AA40CPA8_9PEZI|nr:hypothetical protein B0T16DRAFT_157706 [Cercophora newfieldiana]
MACHCEGGDDLNTTIAPCCSLSFYPAAQKILATHSRNSLAVAAAASVPSWLANPSPCLVCSVHPFLSGLEAPEDCAPPPRIAPSRVLSHRTWVIVSVISRVRPYCATLSPAPCRITPYPQRHHLGQAAAVGREGETRETHTPLGGTGVRRRTQKLRQTPDFLFPEHGSMRAARSFSPVRRAAIDKISSAILPVIRLPSVTPSTSSAVGTWNRQASPFSSHRCCPITVPLPVWYGQNAVPAPNMPHHSTAVIFESQG